MKGFDYSTITEGKLYDVLRPLGKAVCRSRNDVHYVGLENIPKEGGFILASNHLQALDPVYLSIAIEGRQVHYMGKKELFAKLLFYLLIFLYHCVLLLRSTVPRSTAGNHRHHQIRTGADLEHQLSDLYS